MQRLPVCAGECAAHSVAPYIFLFPHGSCVFMIGENPDSEGILKFLIFMCCLYIILLSTQFDKSS